jgi:hypothetical protein
MIRMIARALLDPRVPRAEGVIAPGVCALGPVLGAEAHAGDQRDFARPESDRVVSFPRRAERARKRGERVMVTVVTRCLGEDHAARASERSRQSEHRAAFGEDRGYARPTAACE